MAYPLAYGYSLVGKVVECGSGIDKNQWLGKTVFAFAPHATQVVVDAESAHLVPDGLDPLDAIFMPSVETAVALIQDAAPRLGEDVAVFGQGLIGLLVTAILSGYSDGIFGEEPPGSIATFDTNPNRLLASARCGSKDALQEMSPRDLRRFDVCIEVSGSGKALQAAIDAARDGGRIILGSWYGDSAVSLSLGIDFHRSHKTLIASQVSKIPGQLRGTWSKERRFELAWKLTRRIRPSRVLLSRRTSLAGAQESYERLRDGRELSVAFEYHMR
jgi:threonine dehydrogenase-like Zn-dependent dehydrogenase